MVHAYMISIGHSSSLGIIILHVILRMDSSVCICSLVRQVDHTWHAYSHKARVFQCAIHSEYILLRHPRSFQLS